MTGSSAFCDAPAGRGRQLLLLMLSMAVGGYVRTTISPLQEAIRVALRLTDNQMAVLQGPAVGMPVLLAAIPLGLLIDTYSRARLLRFLVTLSFVGSLLTALSQGFTSLLLARVLAGPAAVAIQPVVFSLTTDLYTAAQRGRATTAVIIGQVIGIAAAFAIGGALLSPDPIVAGGSWQTALSWLTVPLLPLITLTFYVRDPARVNRTIARPSVREIWQALRPYSAVVTALALGIIIVETAVGAQLIWGAPMLSRSFSVAPGRIGAIMAAGMLMSGILGPYIGGTLADIFQRRYGSRAVARALSGLALISAPAGLFAFVSSATYASALLVTDMTLMLAIAVAGMTLFTIVIPNELRGLCLSVLVAANLLVAFAVAPVAVSILAHLLGGVMKIGAALSVVCVLGGLVAAAAFSTARPGEVRVIQVAPG